MIVAQVTYSFKSVFTITDFLSAPGEACGGEKDYFMGKFGDMSYIIWLMTIVGNHTPDLKKCQRLNKNTSKQAC